VPQRLDRVEARRAARGEIPEQHADQRGEAEGEEAFERTPIFSGEWDAEREAPRTR
jgi:hypothetical protein